MIYISSHFNMRLFPLFFRHFDNAAKPIFIHDRCLPRMFKVQLFRINMVIDLHQYLIMTFGNRLLVSLCISVVYTGFPHLLMFHSKALAWPFKDNYLHLEPTASKVASGNKCASFNICSESGSNLANIWCQLVHTRPSSKFIDTSPK